MKRGNLILVENFLNDLEIDFKYSGISNDSITIDDFVSHVMFKKIIKFCDENGFKLFNGILTRLTIIKK